jgi:hypothetical protein
MLHVVSTGKRDQMTMRGQTLFFTAYAVSRKCNAWLFTSPLAHSKSKLDMAREPPAVPPFDDRAAELTALGGDPFFLSDELDGNNDDTLETPLQDEEEVSSSILSPEFMMAAASVSLHSPVNRFVLDGKGPSPKVPPPSHGSGTKKDDGDVWEWDGMVDENAHLDLDDW